MFLTAYPECARKSSSFCFDYRRQANSKFGLEI